MVTILNKKEPISAGREYYLECKSSGSRPPATVTWWKNVKFQQQSTSKVGHFKNHFWVLRGLLILKLKQKQSYAKVYIIG